MSENYRGKLASEFEVIIQMPKHSFQRGQNRRWLFCNPKLLCAVLPVKRAVSCTKEKEVMKNKVTIIKPGGTTCVRRSSKWSKRVLSSTQ